MDGQDAPEGPPVNAPLVEDTGPSARAPADSVHFEKIPKQEYNIWHRLRNCHGTTTMRLRSLLMFIASNIVSYVEPVARKSPSEIISRMCTVFVQGNDYAEASTKDTYLDVLFAKFPDQDSKGMRFHEVYLAVSPMITSVNWSRITLDRTDVAQCYYSLVNVLSVCYGPIAVTTKTESDQLMLAAYVTSVWSAIIKDHPEFAVQNNILMETEDFEMQMKSWIFHPHFENFSRVFVSSCYHILEITDRHRHHVDRRHLETDTTSPRGPPEIEGNGEIQQPLSLTVAPLLHTDPIPQAPTPTVPLNIHPSWQIPGPYPVYEPEFQMQQAMFPPNQGMYPQQQQVYSPMVYPQVDHHIALPARTQTPLGQKRKASDKLPSIELMADSLSKPHNKKGPKPGTRYRERITQESTMILQFVAAIMEKTDSRISKKEISQRTNISLYQVKSFFNRVTAEKKRIESGRPAFRRKYNRRK